MACFLSCFASALVPDDHIELSREEVGVLLKPAAGSLVCARSCVPRCRYVPCS